MSILSVIGGAIKPVTELIDSLHTSGEEKGQLQTELTRLEQSFAGTVLEYEAKTISLQAQVIQSEAQGTSWLQKSWRPITMLTFLVLVVLDSFGWLANPLAPEAWSLLQIGLGGYVIGRSAEKMLPNVLKAIKKENI